MLKITPLSMYKDCSQQDFSHYFSETFLVFNLTENKTRIFVPEQLDGYIFGQYLTRSKEWKPLTLKWEEWWKRLSAIAPFPIAFNLGGGACWWAPNISKQGAGSSGYRKSFPSSTGPGKISFFGKFKAEDKIQQNLVYTAFRDIYKDFGKTPSLAQEALSEKSATACAGDFIVDRPMKRVLYKGTTVGKYDSGRIVLPESQAHLREFMIKSGASAAQIEVH